MGLSEGTKPEVLKHYCIAFHVTSKELGAVLHIYWIVIVGIVYSAFLQNFNAKKRMFQQFTQIEENLQIP